MKKTLVLVVALLFSLSLCQGAAAGEKQPTLIELMQQLTQANADMLARDRAGDTPVYRIDADRFVSEEDIAALTHVLTVRSALLKATNTGGTLPDEAEIRQRLVSELLLTAEADALGLDVRKELAAYRRDGWLKPEPPTPDASDTAALALQGLIRIGLWRGDLTSGTDTTLPYQGSVPLIDALVETLYAKYPSDIAYETADAHHTHAHAYSDPSLGLAFDPPEGWTRADADGGMFAYLAPDGSELIVVAPSATEVNPAMIEGFSIDIVTDWMQRLVAGVEPKDIQPMMFAKTVDTDGKFYALAACSCKIEDAPYAYMMYFSTSDKGMLTGVVAILANGETGVATSDWFSHMIRDLIPKAALTELLRH